MRVGSRSTGESTYGREALPKWTGESKGNGAYYVGAGVFMLFCLAFFSVGGTIRNWVIASSVLSLFMGWGSNFETFNALLFEYTPLYNKFRVPSMAMVILFFLVPFLWTLSIKRMDAVLIRKNDLKPLKGCGAFWCILYFFGANSHLMSWI